jgi:hypothetical protein
MVQQLAGRTDPSTTQIYYLNVPDKDMERAKSVQGKLTGAIPPTDITDPRVTRPARIRTLATKIV